MMIITSEFLLSHQLKNNINLINLEKKIPNLNIWFDQLDKLIKPEVNNPQLWNN